VLWLSFPASTDSAAYFRDYAAAQSTFGVATEQVRALGSQKKVETFLSNISRAWL
jgi:hypothetical protein